MGIQNATTRGVVAALMAVLFAVPAGVLAADGGMSYSKEAASADAISLSVKRGAWLGRKLQIRGEAPQLAGQSVVIERRSARGGGWTQVAVVRVADDGRFGTRWTADQTGRHKFRALALGASTADSADASASSRVRRTTVYRKVMATWYGPGFYGNRTACGQRLTTETLGVAHKTLPCGTRIALRYEGRSVVVPVIDRGPYAKGISFDLTSATADRLGVTATVPIGAARVTR